MSASADLPELPHNLPGITRRIRACESEVPAQLVLEHAMLSYAREAMELGRQHERAQQLLGAMQTTGTSLMNRQPQPTIADAIREAEERGRRAGMEAAARIAESVEAGDGSHDYNAGAETMSERTVAAIRSAGGKKDE